MKKFIYMMMLAVGFMTSCSDDDVVSSSSPSVDNNKIVFTTKSDKMQTRGGVTLTSLSKFDVTAVTGNDALFFKSQQFLYNSTGGFFESTPSYFWPTTGTMNFYAISDPGNLILSASNLPGYTYTNWNGESDLVGAVVKAGEKKSPCPLIFHHLLSQVSVSFEAQDKTTPMTYKIVGLKMAAPSNGVYHFGTVTGTAGSWIITNSSMSEYSYNTALPVSFDQNASTKISNQYWNILPVNDGTIVFRIEYVVIQNGQIVSDFTGSKYKECIVTTPKLAMGKKYCYNFILTHSSDNEIKFTSTIADWAAEQSSQQTPVTPSK